MGESVDAEERLLRPGRHIDIPVLSGRDELDGDAGVIDFYAAARGRDVQGTDWTLTSLTRSEYRTQRQASYQNYRTGPGQAEKVPADLIQRAEPTGRYYDYVCTRRKAKTSITHFQLRHLVSAVSARDVLHVCDDRVHCLDAATGELTLVMDLAGRSMQGGVPGLGSVQVSSLAADDRLVAAGGFGGDLVVRHLDRPGLLCAVSVASRENGIGITNGIELSAGGAHPPRALLSNNDAKLRVADPCVGQVSSVVPLPWPVNFASACPTCPSLVCVVGDDLAAAMVDLHSGARTASLGGHLDYAFAVAWHPDGLMVATGSQDMVTRIWDVRHLRSPLVFLKMNMGATRSLRFSPDGAFLAAAEAADFVHMYDVGAAFTQQQQVDMFGDIAGISFSPCGEALFVGLSEPVLGGILHYSLRRALLEDML